jgi:hypothetical protein
MPRVLSDGIVSGVDYRREDNENCAWSTPSYTIPGLGKFPLIGDLPKTTRLPLPQLGRPLHSPPTSTAATLPRTFKSDTRRNPCSILHRSAASASPRIVRLSRIKARVLPNDHCVGCPLMPHEGVEAIASRGAQRYRTLWIWEHSSKASDISGLLRQYRVGVNRARTCPTTLTTCP